MSEENDRGVCLKVTYLEFDLATCGDVNGTDEGSRTGALVDGNVVVSTAGTADFAVATGASGRQRSFAMDGGTRPVGLGYWLVAGDGTMFSFGAAASHGSTGAQRLNRPMVCLCPPPPPGATTWWLPTAGCSLRVHQSYVEDVPTRRQRFSKVVGTHGGPWSDRCPCRRIMGS